MMEPPAKKYVSSGAEISHDGTYRYKLWREWRGTHDRSNWRWFGAKDGAGEEIGEPKTCLFVMLNPSTADGESDDPTIRRCVGFAKAWRYEYLEVVNLFAYRAMNPADLFAFAKAGGDIIGIENSTIIADAAQRAGIVVCAWGASAAAKGYGFHVDTVRGWLDPAPQFALGFTKDGSPLHPLYVPYDATLQLMP